MFNRKVLSVALALLLACSTIANAQVGGLDQTLLPDQGGTAVTVASLFRIQGALALANVFDDDNRLLRRIAFVETRDGVDPDTYSDPLYNGGIWRVDEPIYDETLNTDAHPELIEIYQAIFVSFQIDWTLTTWVDLRRPLISALAARIFFQLQDQPIPRVGDIEGQGQYWKELYNTNPADTVEDFVAGVDEFELVECPRVGIDLAFAFDSSGSVGRANFELEKEFAAAVVNTFTIGPNETRVGALAYSGFADVAFVLDTFSDSASIVQAIQEIEFFDIPANGPSTNTADALTRLREDILSPRGGSRTDLSSGVARVAVVITDGRSNINQSLTIPSALALQNENVQVFAVGVGNNLRIAELDAIASRPEFQILLTDFDLIEFVGLQRTISAEACQLPVPIPIEVTIEGTLDGGEITLFSFTLPTQGMTLRLEVESGEAVMYASSRIQNPNSAFYDYIIDTSDTGDVYVDPAELPETSSFQDDVGRRKRQQENEEGTVATEAMTNFTNITLFVTIEGVNDVNVFRLETTVGDTSGAVGVHVKSIILLFAVAIATHFSWY